MAESLAVELARQMIRMPTTNPPGDEGELAEHLERVMADAGLATRLYPLSPKRASVVGTLAGAGSRPPFAMVGHIDTVTPGQMPWSFAPFAADIVAGRLRGRGASDMKGGTAAMVAAACTIARSEVRLDGDLIVACTAGEEVDCVGALDLLRQGVFAGASAMLIPEPTDLAVWHVEKGALWLEILMRGKTAHGSMAEEGHNAVGQTLAFLERLVAFPFQQRYHPVLGTPSVSLGTISGGIKVNVVPDRCEARVDVRTLPGEDHDRIVAEAQRYAEEVSPPQVPAPQVSALADRPAVESDREDPFVIAALEAGRAATGREPALGGASYFSDAAVLIPELEIPMVLCGPGRPDLAHQPDEYVEAVRVEEAEEAYVALIRRMLEVADGAGADPAGRSGPAGHADRPS